MGRAPSELVYRPERAFIISCLAARTTVHEFLLILPRRRLRERHGKRSSRTLVSGARYSSTTQNRWHAVLYPITMTKLHRSSCGSRRVLSVRLSVGQVRRVIVTPQPYAHSNLIIRSDKVPKKKIVCDPNIR